MGARRGTAAGAGAAGGSVRAAAGARRGEGPLCNELAASIDGHACAVIRINVSFLTTSISREL